MATSLGTNVVVVMRVHCIYEELKYIIWILLHGVLHMGACSISSLRTFYICRVRRFVTIPANIKKNLITNYVINRLMSILFSLQSRNFIKLIKANINSFGAKFQTTLSSAFLFLTSYRLKRSLYVKLKD